MLIVVFGLVLFRVAASREMRNKFRQIVTMAMDFLAQLRFVAALVVVACLCVYCLCKYAFLIGASVWAPSDCLSLSFSPLRIVHFLLLCSFLAFVQLLSLCKAIEKCSKRLKKINVNDFSTSCARVAIDYAFIFGQLIGLWLPFRMRDIS